jgi:hypothetical protein
MLDGVWQLDKRMSRLACASAMALALIAYAGVPAALAAGASGENAFDELSRGGAEEEETTTKTTSSTSGTSSSSTSSGTSTGTVLLLGVGAAVLLIGGIAFAIMRDARTVAPVGDGPVTGRPARDPAVSMRKRRAKAKAARRQRKRNR